MKHALYFRFSPRHSWNLYGVESYESRLWAILISSVVRDYLKIAQKYPFAQIGIRLVEWQGGNLNELDNIGKNTLLLNSTYNLGEIISVINS